MGTFLLFAVMLLDLAMFGTLTMFSIERMREEERMGGVGALVLGLLFLLNAVAISARGVL